MEFSDDYEKEQKVINIVWANVFGVIIMIPLFFIYCLPYYLLWGFGGIETFDLGDLKFRGLLFLLILLVGVFVHELIHGITWAFFTEKGLKSIKIGVFVKMLTPYCHCKEPLKIKNYVLGALMPMIILGVIPALLAIILGLKSLLLFGFVFTVAACGDILIVWSLRKENKNDYVFDHPSEAGCYVYRKKNNVQ